MSKQRILVVFPPNFAIDQPYLALPALVAFLRANKIEDVHHWDCNIESFWHFLEPSTLTNSLQKIKSRRTALAADGELSDEQMREYHVLCRAELASGPVLGGLDEAKAYFTQPSQERSLEEYTYYMSVLSRAFEIISASYYPTEVSMRDFAMRFSCQDSSDILDAISSSENPYLDYFESQTDSRLNELNPSLVGVSVACMAQIIPAFTFAALVRKMLPEARIVFGGQVFNRLVDAIARLPKLFDLVDYFVVREGETALLRLISHLDGEIPIADVPNLIRFDKPSNQVVLSEHSSVEKIETLPPPDFSDLDLSLYLSPEPVLPYQPVRGCYWHNCSFCNHYAIHAKGVRAKSESRIVSELSHLQTTYGTKYFTFVNESIAPRLLHGYAKAIIASNLEPEWYVGGRLEPDFNRAMLQDLKTSGCRKLYFGLETGSEHVLKGMRKGITLQDAESILQNCGELGIGVHLFLMLGFPTETIESLQQSNAEIRRLASLLDPATLSHYISIYQLKPCTPTFETPLDFGITKIEQVKSGRDLEYLYSFESIDRGGFVDYEEERVRLEALLDTIQGEPRYPENIVHYITMSGAFDRATSSQLSRNTAVPVSISSPLNTLQVRPGLGFGTFMAPEKVSNSSDSSQEPSESELLTISYALDIMFDELLVMQAGEICNVLGRLPEQFDTEKLQNMILSEVRDMEKEQAHQIVTDLLQSGIIVSAA